jgi:predicted unusual protein kinase regulating ubiquinone biosynthesis (AarF/ABC1/UbiB family)
LLYLSQSSGGIYFKAGQYIGTLEKIAPKEYVEVLKVLQD